MDYNEKLWYTKKFHKSGELERKVDKTLSYFSYICYLKKKRLITASEFKFFEYEVKRILVNNQVVEYLYNLYHFTKMRKMNLTFYYLFLYGKRKKFFNKDFYNSKSSIYNNYLNF